MADSGSDENKVNRSIFKSGWSKKNKGFVYKGWVIPMIDIVHNDDNGDEVRKLTFNSANYKKKIYNSLSATNKFMANIDAGKIKTAENYRQALAIYIEQTHREYLTEEHGESDDSGDFREGNRTPELFKQKLIANLLADNDLRQNDRAWSLANPVDSGAGDSAMVRHNKNAKAGGKLLAQKARTQAVAVAAKKIIGREKKKTKSALKVGAAASGAKMGGKKTITPADYKRLMTEFEEMEDQLLQPEMEAIKKGLMKGYLDAEGKLKKDLRPADGAQVKRLIDSTNERMNSDKAHIEQTKELTQKLKEKTESLKKYKSRSKKKGETISGLMTGRPINHSELQDIIDGFKELGDDWEDDPDQFSFGDDSDISPIPSIKDKLGDLIDDDGNLQRPPTFDDLQLIKRLFNEHHKHQTPITETLVYNLDDTDPRQIAMKDAHAQQLASIKRLTQKHLAENKDLESKLDASLKKQIATEQALLTTQQLDAETKTNLQQSKAEHEALLKQHQDLVSKGTAKLLSSQHYTDQIEALKARHALDVAQLQHEVALANAETKRTKMASAAQSRASASIASASASASAIATMGGGENVSLEVKQATPSVIDQTGSTGNSQAVQPPAPAPAPAPRNPLDPNAQFLANSQQGLSQGQQDLFMAYLQARQDRIRQQANAVNQARLTAQMNMEQIRQARQSHQDFLNGVGVQSGIRIPPNIQHYTIADEGTTTYAQNQQQSQSAYDADQSAKEEADYDTKTDDKPDVSMYGYDSQVSKYAKQQGRDFTYTMSMVAKSKNAPSQDPIQRHKQKEALLKEWGYTIGILKAKTNTYRECLEIYTIVFLAEDLYRMERNWKKAIIKFLPHLENLSHQATQQTATQTQLGMITMGQTPMTMTQADELIRQTQIQGSRTRRQFRGTFGSGGSGSGSARPSMARESSAGSQGGFETAESAGSAATLVQSGGEGEGESKTGNLRGQGRRRLTGMGREVSYSRRQDNTIVGQGNYSATGIAAARLPHMPSGVQSVRQIKAQLPRPPVKASKRDGRPKMNVEEAQFRMRKSRINPNLLFVNLDKQNPRLTQEMPIFRPRINKNKLNRIKF